MRTREAFSTLTSKSLGRVSASHTLRRLRGNGCGTSHSLSQQETLEMPTGKEPGSWKEPAGSPCYFSKSLPGSRKNSSRSLLPWRLHSSLPPDPERALHTADSFEPHPVPQPISEGSLPQASLPPPSPATWPPGPQVTQLQASCAHSWAAKQNRSLGCRITPKARASYDGRQHRKSLLRGHILFRTCRLPSKRVQ